MISETNKGITPMTCDSKIIRMLKTTIGPENKIDQRKLEKEMGFLYQAAIGELIYAMVTCRPDIGFAVRKLSQYSNRPAPCHFTAVKNVFRYLLATREEGLTYWRKSVNNDLPDMPEPKPITPSHEWNVNLDKTIHISLLYGFVDSDWCLIPNTDNP